jgi:hypothetical protein
MAQINQTPVRLTNQNHLSKNNCGETGASARMNRVIRSMLLSNAVSMRARSNFRSEKCNDMLFLALIACTRPSPESGNIALGAVAIVDPQYVIDYFLSHHG